MGEIRFRKVIHRIGRPGLRKNDTEKDRRIEVGRTAVSNMVVPFILAIMVKKPGHDRGALTLQPRPYFPFCQGSRSSDQDYLHAFIAPP